MTDDQRTALKKQIVKLREIHNLLDRVCDAIEDIGFAKSDLPDGVFDAPDFVLLDLAAAIEAFENVLTDADMADIPPTDKT
jgi:hypothetical protein